MKACAQWNADDLKGARITGGWLGQVQRLDAGLTLQQRHHARLHFVALISIQGLG